MDCDRYLQRSVADGHGQLVRKWMSRKIGIGLALSAGAAVVGGGSVDGNVATWDGDAHDAVSHGVVAIDSEGVVRVGCLQGNAIREVAKQASGQRLAILQVVGDRLALIGGGANPVWVGAFSNPCR